MKNGLTLLVKGAFLEGDARHLTLVSAHPQIDAATEVMHTPMPAVHISYPGKFVRFKSHNARQESAKTKSKPMASVGNGQVTYLWSTDWPRF